MPTNFWLIPKQFNEIYILILRVTADNWKCAFSTLKFISPCHYCYSSLFISDFEQLWKSPNKGDRIPSCICIAAKFYIVLNLWVVRDKMQNREEGRGAKANAQPLQKLLPAFSVKDKFSEWSTCKTLWPHILLKHYFSPVGSSKNGPS